MNKVIIDGRSCKTKEQAHEHIKKQMDLPPYYGKNLDALHDVLTSFREPIYFRIEYSATLVACLGNYGKTLLQVFKDAAAENENITLEIE